MPRILALTGLAWLANLALFGAFAPAAFVAVANHTDQDIRFTVTHPTGPPASFTLTPGECRPVPVGRDPEVSFPSAGKDERFRLIPYTAYVFVSSGQALVLRRVELAGVLPKPEDVPEQPVARKSPVKLAVKIAVDDADPRAQATWEKVIRARVAAVSAILERQCGVAVEVTATTDWTADPDAMDLPGLLRDFEHRVKPDPAVVVIGFTSRALERGESTVLLECTTPTRSHILIHELFPRSEPERVEVLLHQLAHRLGAVHVPDPNSAMRTALGDGKANTARFQPGLDPLNVLAVGLWAGAMRPGKPLTAADLPPPTLSRLLVIYRTFQELSPNDQQVRELLTSLDRVRAARAGVNAPAPEKPLSKPEGRKPAATGTGLSPVQQGARAVVRAIAIRATDLNRLPPAERPRGDRLTAELVRAAADTALSLDEEVQSAAFLIGIGLGLDDSTVLLYNPLTRGTCRPIETDAERRERLTALGSPTVHNRRDLCQHFAISAALAELLGPGPAEAAGLTKELIDMGRESGFSFADLAADHAGVALASAVKTDRGRLTKIRSEFEIASYVPGPTGLAEGLNRKQFESQFGGAEDSRFKEAMAEIRKRVADLPAYRK